MGNNNTQSYHYLYVPGNKLDYVYKAIDKGVKCLIIDLEDSIPLSEKKSVREKVSDLIYKNKLDIRISVRVNSDTELQINDLESLLNTGIQDIFIPKLEIDSPVITNSYNDKFNNVIGIVETATGLKNLDVITEKVKLSRIAIGEVDFSADLGIEENDEALLFYRSKVVFKSKYLNLEKPISGVYKDLRNLEGLENFAKYIKNLGFGGMQAVHPDQVAIIDSVFKPTLEEIDEAHNLLLEIQKNEKRGIGVFVDSKGSIVDNAMVKKAEEIINQSE